MPPITSTRVLSGDYTVVTFGTVSLMNLLPPATVPDLSALQAQSEWSILMRVLGGGGSQDQLAQTLVTNCIRLLDAAVNEYCSGAYAINQFHARDPSHFALGHIFRATTHFESCIWHFERFIKHAKALRSLKSAETELKQLIPAALSFLKQDAEGQITKLRHTLAHLEGATQRGDLPPGKLIALMPTSDGLIVGDHAISWDDLALWLEDAHDCVKRLSNFKP